MSNNQYFTIKDPAIRRSFEDLDNISHSHNPQTAIPKDSDGSIGSIVPINDGTNFYLYVKFPDGWKKFQAI
jgi:hypothetical protein